ncbi:putative secreted beta-glucosidase [Micromonospora noduli]|uniref:Putative secreted beta-glucosidase n=1 Tax=Micromonospora noduli TaxID=709876 RepID=A0A328MXN2_9ACTN|nr:putative secreted beta-glucosidase [Micromonospora noduli]
MGCRPTQLRRAPCNVDHSTAVSRRSPGVRGPGSGVRGRRCRCRYRDRDGQFHQRPLELNRLRHRPGGWALHQARHLPRTGPPNPTSVARAPPRHLYARAAQAAQAPERPKRPKRPNGPNGPNGPSARTARTAQAPERPERPKRPNGPSGPSGPSARTAQAAQAPERPERPKRPNGPNGPSARTARTAQAPERPERPKRPKRPNGPSDPATLRPCDPATLRPEQSGNRPTRKIAQHPGCSGIHRARHHYIQDRARSRSEMRRPPWAAERGCPAAHRGDRLAFLKVGLSGTGGWPGFLDVESIMGGGHRRRR